jgi:aminoglycoside/choline kinase family phosphotransferase
MGGDASSRAYFRLDSADKTYVLMITGDLKELRIWFILGRLFEEKAYPLPHIYAADLKRGFSVAEDLGDDRLDKIFNSGSGYLKYYEAAAKFLAEFHNNALAYVQPFRNNMSEPYTAEFALEMELNYFLKGLTLINFPFKYTDKLRLEGTGLTRRLLSLMDKSSLIHRDFQSRNLMTRGDSAFVIDWQGAREGPFQYDLASLLYDPYVSLSPEDTDKILSVYLSAASRGYRLERLREDLVFFGVIRLFQAFGAYARLTKTLNKPGYAGFLKTAAERLEGLFSNLTLKEYPLMTEIVTGLNLALKEGRCAL